MAKKPMVPERTADKGEGSDSDVPMERFKSLTRQLLNVSNKRVREEVQAKKKARKKRM